MLKAKQDEMLKQVQYDSQDRILNWPIENSS